jgi:outer membrane biosynthesis protein TonB
MMERSEKTGLGIAAAGHLLLFGALSLGWLARSTLPVPQPPAIDVSMVDKVGLVAQAPQSTEAPQEAKAPEVGKLEQAPAPKPEPKAEPEPEPAPPVPQPKAAPPPKPEPKAKPEPIKKVVAKQTPEKVRTPPKRQDDALASIAADIKAQGKTANANGKHDRASLLGDDFKKRLAQGTAHTGGDKPQAANISAVAMAGIVDAIKRQIQPCADRQVIPGPGASDIGVKLDIRLNPDGTLAAAPIMIGEPRGVTPDNARYVQRVRDLGVAAFKGCSPLKLPAEYYATANGGWNHLTYNWSLRRE